MARKQSLKYLMKEELGKKFSAGYGRSKYQDQQKTRQERQRLANKGVAYEDRIRLVDYTRQYVYCQSTFDVYSRSVGYFADWLANTHNIKKVSSIEECEPYIQEYMNWMDAEGLSAYTIQIRLASICKSFPEPLCMLDFEHKSRSIAHISRGKGKTKNQEYSSKKAKETLEINRLLGMRREALRKLKASDIKEVTVGDRKLVIVESIGKGKKYNQQIFYDPEEQRRVLQLKKGKAPDERICNPEDFHCDANFHKERELRCKEVYYRVKEEIESSPEKKKFYQDEVRRLFAEANRSSKELDMLDKPVYVRGENRQRLLDEGREIAYDRTSLLICSLTVTNHFRSSVTLEFYASK